MRKMQITEIFDQETSNSDYMFFGTVSLFKPSKDEEVIVRRCGSIIFSDEAGLKN